MQLGSIWFGGEKVWLGGHKIQFGVEFCIRVGDGRSTTPRMWTDILAPDRSFGLLTTIYGQEMSKYEIRFRSVSLTMLLNV
jgi:hypothetical protein